MAPCAHSAPFVARFRASTLNRLLDGVGGEHAEHHGDVSAKGRRSPRPLETSEHTKS